MSSPASISPMARCTLFANPDHLLGLERTMCSNYICCRVLHADLHALVGHWEQVHPNGVAPLWLSAADSVKMPSTTQDVDFSDEYSLEGDLFGAEKDIIMEIDNALGEYGPGARTSCASDYPPLPTPAGTQTQGQGLGPQSPADSVQPAPPPSLPQLPSTNQRAPPPGKTKTKKSSEPRFPCPHGCAKIYRQLTGLRYHITKCPNI